jgi:hypothetical protein
MTNKKNVEQAPISKYWITFKLNGAKCRIWCFAESEDHAKEQMQESYPMSMEYKIELDVSPLLDFEISYSMDGKEFKSILKATNESDVQKLVKATMPFLTEYKIKRLRG